MNKQRLLHREEWPLTSLLVIGGTKLVYKEDVICPCLFVDCLIVFWPALLILYKICFEIKQQLYWDWTIALKQYLIYPKMLRCCCEVCVINNKLDGSGYFCESCALAI